MTPITPAEDTASITSDSSIRASFATPNTETEESAEFESSSSCQALAETMVLMILSLTIVMAHGRVLACHPGGHLRLEKIDEAEIHGPIPSDGGECRMNCASL